MRNIRYEVFGTNKGLDGEIKLNEASGVLCKDQRFSLGEEELIPYVWFYTESVGFINWFLPRTPNEPRFIFENSSITGFKELKSWVL